MITLHLEVENPRALVEDVKQMFNLVERTAGTPAAAQAAVEAVLAADVDPVNTAAPAKKPRATKKAVDTAPSGDVQEAAPAFLDGPKTEEPKAEAAAPMSLDDMRKAMNELAAAKGMDAVASLLATFRGADGTVCQKASQVIPEQRALLAAKCAELKG